jgi:hypothetical protein
MTNAEKDLREALINTILSLCKDLGVSNSLENLNTLSTGALIRVRDNLNSSPAPRDEIPTSGPDSPGVD